MITIYDAKATDFSSNGLGVLAPLSCKVSRELNKSYQVELVHARDEAGKWRLLAYERILRVPVPEDKTPALSLSGTTVHEVWKVATNGSRLHMRSGPSLSAKIIGKYANGTRVTLVEKTNSSWYRMMGPDGRTGYMSTDWLSGPVGQQEMPGGEDIEVQSKQVRDQPFRIYKIAYTADTITAYARHLFFDLADDPVLSLKLTQASGQNALKQIFDAAYVEHEFVPYTDIADAADMEISQKMVSEALLGDGGFVDTYGGEVMFDWYDVYVMQALGEDRGMAIRRGKDLTSMKGEDSVDGMVTRVIPIGKDKNGNDLFLPGDIAVKSEQEEQYAVKRTRVLRVNDAKVDKNQNAEAAYEKMRKAAEEMLADGADAPESTLNVGFVDLTRSAFASGQGMQPKLYVGDTVTVIDDVLGLNAKQRVQAYTFDALSERYLSVTLGDEAPTTFAPTITRRQLPDQIISGEMLAPGAVDAGALQDGSVSGDKVQEGAIEEKHLGAGAVRAQAIEALRGEIHDLTSNSMTTDELYADIATIAQAQLITANIQDANIDWAQIGTLASSVAEISKAHLSDADIDWARIHNLASAIAEIAEAEIREAKITTAQIENLTASVAEIIHETVGVGEFTMAEVQNLLANALILEEGVANSMMITNLAVTSANILSATLDKLVIRGEDGKYYHVFVGADGVVSTEETTVSAGEIEAGETQDGRRIVASTANVASLNATTIKASQAIIATIFTESLTAGKITAGDALIASATIPTLYVTSLKAIGNSIDISANESIELVVDAADNAQSTADVAQNSADFSIPHYGDTPPSAPIPEGKVWIDSGVDPIAVRRWIGSDLPVERSYTDTITSESAPVVFIDNSDGHAEGIALEAGCVSIQSGSGDPSPQNIRPITGRSSVEVRACGRNLLESARINNETQPNTIVEIDGNSVRIAADSLTYRCGRTHVFLPPGNYIIAADIKVTKGTNRIGRRISADGGQTYPAVLAQHTGGNQMTFTVQPGEEWNQFTFFCSFTNAEAGDVTYSNIRLYSGSSADDFEPYHDLGGGVITPSTALYGVGKVNDVVSVGSKGDVLVTHRTSVKVLDGTENFNLNSGWVTGAYYVSGALDGLKQLDGFGTIANIMCSHATAKTPASIVSSVDNIGIGIGNGTNASLYLNLGSQYATVADFKAYLAAQYAAGTPVTIVYELAEPVTETLAPITPVGTPKDTIHIAADSTHLHAALTCSGWETVSDTSGMSQEMVVMRSTIQQLVGEIALKVAKGDLETYLRLMQEGVYIGKSDSIYRVFIDDAGMHVQQYGEDIAVFAKRTLITPYIRVGPPDSPSGLAISKASDGGMMITNLGVIV